MMTAQIIAFLQTITSLRVTYPKLLEVLERCHDVDVSGKPDLILEAAHVKSGGIKPKKPNLAPDIIDLLKRPIFGSGVGSLFREIHQCEDKLEELSQTLSGLRVDTSHINRRYTELRGFELILQQFIATPEAHQALDLVRAGGNLYLAYENTRATCHAVMEALTPAESASDREAAMTIYVPSEQTFREVVEKLDAMADLYDEVCNLADISPAEFPLRVSKIESGSLWLRLFGESKVIALITKLIENGASFTYRNFTQEGKLREIPRNIETIRAELKLLEELEKAGIPTGPIKENIEKSAVIITDKINTLLSGSSEITVNEKDYGVRQEFERVLLERSKVRLIEDGSQHQEAGGEETDRGQLIPTDDEQG